MLEDQRKRRLDSTAITTIGPTSARKKPMLNNDNTNLDSSNPSSETAAGLPSLDLQNHHHQSIDPSSIHRNEDDQLENFRKEALWRQLQEYKRDLRRAQEKIQHSEDQKSQAESQLAAIDICWNQLVEDVRLLFKDSSIEIDTSALATPLGSIIPSSPTHLDRALHQRATASKDLILHLISLASSSSVSSPDLEQVRARCRHLTAESATSRAALGLAESKLKQLQDQLEVAEEAARRAEKKLDRERSRTVKELDAQGQGASTSHIPKSEPQPNDNQPTIQPNPDHNGIHYQPTPEPPTVINGSASVEHQLNQELPDFRARELDLLKEQLLHRAHEIDLLQCKLINLSDDIVHDTTAYKRLKTEVIHLKLELERTQALLETAQKESDQLRERQDEFRNSIVTEMTNRLEDMEKKLASKDADVTRIRATREEARAELHELKSRDAEKMKQVAQIRTLANSRQDRINALASEVRRLKMRLAAETGDQNLVNSLANDQEIELAKALQERLNKAEETIKSLHSQMEHIVEASNLQDATALIRSEADSRQELVTVRKQLEELRELIGPNGNPELVEMSNRIQLQIERQKVLEAKLAAQEASASMLYTEVDRLSTAWAALDEQNRDKVFKLVEHDEKILKAVHEKAKADNRYFSAMRANEALKSQTAVLEKMAEKQTVTISKMSDELRAVSTRLTAAEREITIHQKVVEAHKQKIAEISIENADLSARCSQHDQKMSEVGVLLQERTSQIEIEASARRTAEESAQNLEKELQKAKARLLNKEGREGLDSAEVTELKSFNEDLTKMLKCNSCKQRFKSHVITRCMHLFCGACLEARLETRQRKCPTCSIAFGTNDVSAVYF
ncbi:hypothetical protein O181_015811 [Austropuccinia psidii MF-1]|uniref:E3 ubiquitin protein ligase n=1 Tax=Austropuccinia psidii MF-1 TaxID=1389203 RepID=A0A9Q3GQG3_9BASI|nr:hypothetical protein [Austropuccinia psidii MF-1]